MSRQSCDVGSWWFIQAVSLKEADSDLEVDEDGGKSGLPQGPARLPSFKPELIGKSKKDSDVHCDVCGDADTGEK